MNRSFTTMMTGALLAALATTSASAQDAASARDIKRPRANLPAVESTERVVVPEAAVDAPNARIAALIRRDLVVPRNKGVQSVRRLSAGIYCILPTAASGVSRKTAIVQLTPEYYFSLLNEIKVQWAFNGSGCADNELAVYTMSDRNRTGAYRFTNDVSFSIYVP